MMELVSPKTVSVKRQFSLLEQVVKDPEAVAQPLRDALFPALTSQGSFAAFDLPEAGIVGMSLNTHKTISNEALDGRFAALNEYRKAALDRLRNFNKRKELPGRGTIDWYKSELAEKAERLSRVANDIALMSQQLDDVLALAQQMAQAADQEAEFHKRRNELLRKFRKPL